MDSPLLYSTAFFLNTFENPYIFVSLVLLGCLLAALFKARYGMLFFLTMGLTYGVTSLLKATFQITRPDNALITLDSYRFPSMHASIAGAFVTSIAWHLFFHTESVLVRISIVILSAALIAFVGWTRLLLGVHELIDVLAGAAIGVGIALLLHFVTRWYIRSN